jgi:hypothetical protein
MRAFIVDWLRGDLPHTEEAFARMTAAMSPRFYIVDPGGVFTSGEDYRSGLYEAHGDWAEAALWVRNVVLRGSDAHHWATHEEWMFEDGLERGRVVTALFENDEHALNGVVWQFVHETWLPVEED